MQAGPRSRAARCYAIDGLPTSHSKLDVSKAKQPCHFHAPQRLSSSRECACKPLDGIVGADMDAKQLRRRQKSNQAVAKCIPVFLICVVAYASWVFVGPLCGKQRQSQIATHSVLANNAQWNTSSIHPTESLSA